MSKRKRIVCLLSLILLVLGGLFLGSSLSLNALGSYSDNYQKVGYNQYVSMVMSNPKAVGTINIIKSSFDSSTYKNDLSIAFNNGNNTWSIVLEYNVYDNGGGLVQKSYTHDITQTMKTYYNQDNDMYVYKFSHIFITMYEDSQVGFMIELRFVNIQLIDNNPVYDDIQVVSLDGISMNNDFDVSNFYAMYQGILGSPANTQYLEYNNTLCYCLESNTLSDDIVTNGLIDKWLEYLSPSFYGTYATAFARGYVQGHTEGYNEAINSENGLGQVWGIIGSIFQGVGQIFSIEIVPHINIGTILIVPIVIGLVGFILWIWRKN